MSEYNELLELMKKHTTMFQSLADIQQAKLQAAKTHNTAALEECMKKEQADTLCLRGYDKKRLLLLDALSLSGKTFQELIPLLPSAYQSDYTKAFQELNNAYGLYQSSADCAKQIIEVNLYQVTNIIEKLKQQTDSGSGEMYSQTGNKSGEQLTFKDMKV